ncbi:MAG: FHA domain-containing protein, partial [Solirubrobacteraceae bacterium]
ATPRAAGAADLRESVPEAGSTMIFSNSQRVRGAVESTGPRRRSKALLVVSGRRMLLGPAGAELGRSRECDIVLDDSSISRRHAEVRPGVSGWTIEDLDSTNGVRVNGVAVHDLQPLHTGDRIEMGSTEIFFEIAP